MIEEQILAEIGRIALHNTTLQNQLSANHKKAEELVKQLQEVQYAPKLAEVTKTE